MNCIVQLCQVRQHLRKDLLRTTKLCRQLIPVASYSEEKPKVTLPKNVHPHKDKFLPTFQKETGKIYDTKPFKIRLKPDRDYFWCLCGKSHSQPLCDGNHRDAYKKTPLRPIRFRVEEDKEYWLCNCKQTKLRPFCDGTHKTLPPSKLK